MEIICSNCVYFDKCKLEKDTPCSAFIFKGVTASTPTVVKPNIIKKG